jgi:serine/threonine protein phosphatase PrpC
VTAMAGSTELRSGGASDTGRVRTNNQDSYLIREDLGLWVVADGMGGHRGGEVASRIVCETVDRSYARHTIDGLVESIESGNAAVYQAGSGDPDLSGMGTTIVALALVDDGEGDEVLAVANVGDSRVYRLSGTELDQLTNDHSYVAELVREGSLTPEEAAVHPQRNRLTRVIGVYDDVPVDVLAVVPHNGDRYVLCSDGLFNEVPESGIAAVLRRLADPTDAANELVRLANEGGGRDNVTVVVVDVVDDAARGAIASSALAGDPATTTATHPGTLAGGPAGAATTGAGGADTYTEPDADAEERLDGGRRRPRHSRSADGGPRHRAQVKARRVTWRVVLFVILLLALLGGAFATIQWYGQSTYYVGFQGDQVAIFKGRPGGVLWIDPELVDTTDLARERVPADTVDDVTEGHEAGSRGEAEQYVERLTERADQLSPTTTTTTTTTTSTTRPGGLTTTTRGTLPTTTR